ncbi:MAG: hypothetical protein MN733_02490 [Nitrososphaera sp.]|nr:hypothetical protein [Nitrososphaera sp.]
MTINKPTVLKTLAVMGSAAVLAATSQYATAGRAWEKQFDSTPITLKVEKNYVAYLTCGMGDNHLNILGCFSNRSSGDTELELKNGDEYGLYKVYNIRSLGQETQQDGLIINLKAPFEIKAQNADDTLILGIKIVETNTGNVVFRKQVGTYGVIAVTSGE